MVLIGKNGSGALKRLNGSNAGTVTFSARSRPADSFAEMRGLAATTHTQHKLWP